MASKLADFTERSDMSYMDDKKGASQDEFVLERVQGLTSTSLHSLASNPVTGWVTFPAACVLVLLDPKTNEQKFIESPSLRNISCCAFTDDGRFVAFGETGMKPHIAMWNLREHKECHKFVVDNSLRALFFHPKSTIIISLGLNENLIAVWDYERGMRLAACKWQTMPLSLTIPRVGSNLVVCGHRKITLFNISKVHSCSYETNVFQDRKTVLLGKQSEYTFIDVESGRGKYEKVVYTVTSCGYLCEIKLGDILIDKALKVDTQTFCVRYSSELLFVGCRAGVVKICDPDNLTVTAAVSLSNLLGPSAMPKVGNKCYLDVCTLVVDEKDKIVTCVYADCSMHSWQIGTDGEKIVCSAIEPAVGSCDPSGHPSSKSNLLRSFIGCCKKTKSCNEILSKFSFIEQNKPPQQYGGRCLVNENRASYQDVNAVRFTPDGKDVICGNEEGEIKVYELSTGILRRVIEAHSSQVTCIELMYDGDFQLVCSGGRDRVMFVLDARNDFSLVQVLCDHSAAIVAISLVNHKGVLTLVSAAADNVILIRRAILGGTLRFTITGEIAQTNCSRSFFVTSDFIALGGKDSQIKVFKADPVFQSKPVKTINCQKLSPSNAGFKAIGIDPSSSFMAVSQCNGNISVYHLQTGQPVASLPLQSDITNIHFTSDLRYMISSTSNGCDLVWRLPERMTEFMRSKQDKIYQIETSKEVTSEAYVACVKVCKEEVDEEEDVGGDDGFNNDDEESTDQQRHKLNRKMRRNFRQQQRSNSCEQSRRRSASAARDMKKENFHLGHIAQNSSNHNSEWDRTPSIDSMSLLDEHRSPLSAPGRFREEDNGKFCSSESMLNCSMCTHSVSTTTHTSCCSAVPTESSISPQQGRNEHSTQLRFYCGPDHDLFSQVIDEGHCIKLGPFRDDYPARGTVPQSDMSQQGSRRISLEETSRECYLQNHDNIDSVTRQEERAQDVGIGDLGKKYNEGQHELIPKTSQAEVTCPLKEPSLSNKSESNVVGTPLEVTKPEDVSGQECKKSQEEMKPSPSHNISQNSETNYSMCPASQEQRYPKSKKILEKALFYEGVMRGGVRSRQCSSPTRQHTIAVGKAVRSASKPKSNVVQVPNFVDDDAKKSIKESCVDVEDGPLWTPLTTPDYSNTSSNITNLVPSSSSTMLELCRSGKLNEANKSPCQKNHKSETVETAADSTATLGDCEIPTLPSPKAAVHDYDTTHGDGESLRSDLDEKMMSAKSTIEDNFESCENGQDIECDNQILDLSINLGNMDLNSGIEDADKTITEFSKVRRGVLRIDTAILNSEQDLKTINPSAGDIEKAQVAETSSLIDEGAKEMLLGHVEEGAARQKTVLDKLEQEGFTIPEKYRSALRSCMQLSNSQETFATLRVDTNDMELMAFLSHALKKKLVAAGLIGLSCNEIDSLLSSGVKSADTSEQFGAVGGAVEDVNTLEENHAQVQAENKCDQEDLKTLPQSKSEGSYDTQACHSEHQTKETGVLNAAGTTAVRDDSWKQEKEKSCDDPRAPNSLSSRRPISPLSEAKRKMYKSIMSRMPCAWKSNKNRSNPEAVLKLSEVRNLLQANMNNEEFNICTHSDVYLRQSCPKEDHVLRAEPETPENLSPVTKSADGFGERTEKSYGNLSPKCLTIYSDKQSCTFQKQTTRPSVNRNAQKSFPRGRGRSYNQGRLSPLRKGNNQCKATTRLESVRVHSRSSSSPGTAACRELSGTDRTPLSGEIDRRCFHSPAQWLMSAASPRRGEAVAGETDQSRTESFVSAVSRDAFLERCSESDSGVDAEFYHEKPMMEIFRDQDEYLRKLKEVRENFERSIQALSAERKSRQAAEGRGRCLARK